jgi:hypothetical protein
VECGEKDCGAGGPGESAEPVEADEEAEGILRRLSGVLAEAGMERDVADGGGDPDDEDESGEGDRGWEAQRCRAEWRVEGGEGGEEFEEHGWKDDPGGALGVDGLVAGEVLRSYFGEEWVMDDLDEPDEAGHEEGCGDLDKEEGGGHDIV